jgi:phage head maturation protease
MADETEPTDETPMPVVIEHDDPQVTVRSAERRELDIRIMPWGVSARVNGGTEEFARGAFDGTIPSKVLLMGLEHEVHFGIGQNGPTLTRHPVGRGMTYEDRPDGAHMTFKVAATQRGDEVLALASEGIVDKASVEVFEIPGGNSVTTSKGRRHRIHTRAELAGVSTTYRPAYGEQAAVLAVRSRQGEPEMTEPVAAEAITPPAPPAPAIDISPITAALERMAGGQEAMADRLDKIETRSRQDFTIPNHEAVNDDARSKRGLWAQTVLRMLSGERVQDLEVRVLDELITSDNIGVVPPAYLTEMIGVIDPARPFLNSTRKLDLPAAGMSLIVPKIVTRPETGVQAAEKDDIASNTTSITTVTYNAVTIAGGGDLSLQLLKRSSPSFLSLYIELLAESYAVNAETQALTALLAAGVTSGGALDPEDANFGAAWVNGAAVKKTPNTIWLSSEGVAKFIDAKATGTNAPLYSNIQAGFTAGAGPAGTISGLRPVYVPQLDTVSATIDAIVGPSSGFGWTEDGTYTLQVDVPAKAGRDVAIVGMLWFAPMYPTAFTTYTIAS